MGTKGGAFEWEVARALSRWITNGRDDSQLIRSEGSGGWSGKTGTPQEWRHVGDVAPNGPDGERFRRRFAVECKHRKDFDWWHIWTAAPGDKNLLGWWHKLLGEIEAASGVMEPPYPEPLVVFRQNYRPTMAVLRRGLVEAIHDDVASLILPNEDLGALPFESFLALDPAVLGIEVG